MHPRGDEIVAVARSWIGTPYHHQASVKGVGADCLGFIRGIYSQVAGRPAERPPGYSRDWGEVGSSEPLIAAARRHLVEVPMDARRPGDVLIFRLRAGFVAKHVALLASGETMIHATEGDVVREVAFCGWWRRRLACVFRFPD